MRFRLRTLLIVLAHWAAGVSQLIWLLSHSRIGAVVCVSVSVGFYRVAVMSIYCVRRLKRSRVAGCMLHYYKVLLLARCSVSTVVGYSSSLASRTL